MLELRHSLVGRRSLERTAESGRRRRQGVAKAAVEVKAFEEIFKSPSLDQILSMNWPDFEGFVQHVFECAGYYVENVASQHDKHYVDLLLRQGHATGKVLAAIEVRRYSTAHIIRGAVLKFAGALHIEDGIPGFLITTSEFTGPAYRNGPESPRS